MIGTYKMTSSVKIASIILFSAIQLSNAIFAETMTSGSHSINSSDINITGSKGSSADHVLVNSSGVSSGGSSSTSDHIMGMGFIYTVIEQLGLAPTVVVTKPGLHDKVRGGANYPVTWESSSMFGIASNSTTVEFSSNDGSTWTKLASNLNTSPYNWSVGAINTGLARIRVTVRDTMGNIGIGTGEVFTIDSTAPQVTVTDPSNLATNVAVNTDIVITFSETMDAGTVLTTIYPAAPWSASWNTMNTQVNYDPATDLATDQKYLVTVESSAKDIAGNPMSADHTFSFRTTAGSLTTEININGRRFLSGDILPPDKDNLLEVKCISSAAIETAEAWVEGSHVPLICSPGPPACYTGHFTVSPVPGQQAYHLTFYARDGFATERLITLEAMVLSGGAKIVDVPLNYPNPFEPLSADPAKNTTRIQYKLTNDANVAIKMFNIGGELVKEWNYSKGAAGGKAGVNNFSWNGRNLLGGVVGNGMYIYVIIADGKKVGSGKLVVFDRKH